MLWTALFCRRYPIFCFRFRLVGLRFRLVVFVLDKWVFVLDQWVFGLRSSFLGLCFRHIQKKEKVPFSCAYVNAYVSSCSHYACLCLCVSLCLCHKCEPALSQPQLHTFSPLWHSTVRCWLCSLSPLELNHRWRTDAHACREVRKVLANWNI